MHDMILILLANVCCIHCMLLCIRCLCTCRYSAVPRGFARNGPDFGRHHSASSRSRRGRPVPTSHSTACQPNAAAVRWLSGTKHWCVCVSLCALACQVRELTFVRMCRYCGLLFVSTAMDSAQEAQQQRCAASVESLSCLIVVLCSLCVARRLCTWSVLSI